MTRLFYAPAQMTKVGGEESTMRTIGCRSAALVAILFVFLISDEASACEKSTGKTEKDKEVAKKMCAVFKEMPDVEAMTVDDSILHVDVSEAFYRQLASDRDRGSQVVRNWMTGLQQESGRRSVTVWVYWDKKKRIEGDTTITGEKRVRFLQ
jgi:hypothetical protein